MDDPFASITELCHISASQEERLRHCGFATGRDGCSDHDANEDSDDPTQPMEMEVESTGIVMVSLPETFDEEEEQKKDDSTPQDLFQTPTEGSLLASSEEQQPPVAADDPAVDGPRAPEPNCTDGDEAVDLGKDSDLGFPEPSKKLGLSKNLDSEAQLTHQDTEIIEEMAVEENKDEEEAQLSMEGSSKRKLEFPYGDTVIVDSESEEDDWEEGEEKNQEKLREKANGSVRYRVLPASMAQEENRAEGVKNNRGVIGKEVTILDVLKMLKQRYDDEEKDDGLKSVSVSEICMRRGVTFPRPCWWPEKGFEVFDDEDE